MKGQALFVAVGMFAGLASGADAQVPGINLNLFPRIGVFKPTSELAESAGNSIELKGGTAIGLSAELALPVLPMNLRANLDYVLGTGVKIDDVDAGSDDHTLLVLTGDLVFRLAPGISPIQPYLLAGLGVKQYDFAANTFGAPDKESDLTGHVGGGLAFKLGPLALVGEVSDYISSFKLGTNAGSKLQNDLFAMVGFRIGMF